MLNVYFWNKNEKMLRIDLNSDLKKKPDLKMVYTICAGKERILNMLESAEICPNMGKYSSISVTKNITLWICLNMRETLRS